MGSDGAVIQLVTRCSSEQEFVERFARFTSETDVVVPALPHVAVGTAGQFVIRLKDRSIVMQGRCEVTEIRSIAVEAGGAVAPPARALMRLRLHEMDAHSAGIHLRLMERRAPAAKPPAAPAPVRSTPARSLSLVPPVAATPPPAPAPRLAEPPKPAPPPSTMQVMTIPRPPPLRSVPLPGVVAAPSAVLGSAGAIVVAAASPAQSEPTEVSPSPRPEARAPGAAFTLPANPLSDLDATDLASFIEMTLLETKASVDPAPVPSGGGDRAAAVVPIVGAPANTNPSRVAPAAASPPRPRLDVERARRIALRVAPYAACLIVGVVLGNALRPSAKVAVMVGTPSVVAPVAAAPPSTEPAPPPGLEAPAPRDCAVRVTTTPKGAAVFWGDLAIGSSPIEHAAVPCGSATVTFRRERYAEATRTIAVERGHGAVVNERLYRPPARLMVTSSPPNAVIKFNKRRIGPAPRRISTMRFEHVRIEASLPGYQPWKKTVYLKEAEPRVDVTLVPIARPAARRAPAPAAAPPRATPPPAAAAAPAAPARAH